MSEEQIKTIRLKPRTIQAVQFTGANAVWLATWVQSNSTFRQVTATPERLYLPSVEGVDILEVGDWVLFDTEERVFRGASDKAIQDYYEEV